MTIGTIFTLFVVPSLYMLIAKRHSAGETVAVGITPVVEAARGEV
jgi:hypothetical protein